MIRIASAWMREGDFARVDYIRALPPGIELRVANVTVGETGGVLNLRGVPISSLRDSPDYMRVLNRLAEESVGGPGAAADQALVADVFFSKTAPGVTPRFVTADKNVVNKLADIAGLAPARIGGFPELLARYGTSGFNVTIDGWTITVIPVR